MPGEKRRHLRLPVESKVFIELVSPGVGGGTSGKVAVCRTLDVSRGGIRVSLQHELAVGAILQIGIELPQRQDTLYLAGEVKWCLPDRAPGPGWCAGFALLNAGGSDIDSWISLLVEMES